MKCSDAQYNYIIHDSVIKFVNTKEVPLSTWCNINKVNLFWKYSHEFQKNNECLQWTWKDVTEKRVSCWFRRNLCQRTEYSNLHLDSLCQLHHSHTRIHRCIYIRAGGGGRSNTHLPPFHNQKLWIFVEIFSQKLFKIFSAISWSSFRIPPLSQFAVSEHHQLPDISSHQILVAIAFN